jgi:hypothetical protein
MNYRGTIGFDTLPYPILDKPWYRHAGFGGCWWDLLGLATHDTNVRTVELTFRVIKRGNGKSPTCRCFSWFFPAIKLHLWRILLWFDTSCDFPHGFPMFSPAEPTWK